MTQRQSFALLIAHMLLALGILAAATVLCAIGKLQADAVIALFGAAVGLLGGNAQSLGQAAINGGPKPDLTKLAEQGSPKLAASLSGRGVDYMDTPDEHVTTPAPKDAAA